MNRKQLQINKHTSFVKVILTVALAILLAGSEVRAQDDLDLFQNNNWIHFSDAPNSLYHHIAGQAYSLLDKRAGKVAGIRSLADRRQRLSETLTDVVGPFPERTPLNAKVVRSINKDDYRVEHIVYESQPGFYVTSSMFIPDGLKGKAPVVIYASGHTHDGYRRPKYQHIILNLVKKGFIVFAFDPVGQGERFEYYDSETGKSSGGDPSKEHSYSGAQAFITGSSQARYMIWDGIRAVDYLITRPEVDPAKIGITGRSGGGTQSAYIAAFDERIYAVAPGNYITNFTRLIQSVGPQDAEQNLPDAIARGIDHADLLVVRAPKPALVLATTNDYFSIQGARETAKEVSTIYRAYGKEGNFSMVESDAGHASTQGNREAMYAFFQTHLDNPGDSKDQEVEILSEKEIRVTKTGQVSTSIEGETVFSLNRNYAKELVNKLQTSRKDLSSHIPAALRSAKELSGYHEPTVTDESIFIGRIQRDGYVIEKYIVPGEGDYIIPYLLMVPDKPNSKGLIYLNPLGKVAQASVGGEMEWFVRQGFTVMAPDMIGVGEMGPGDFHGDSYIEGNSYNVWYASMLIGRSIVGIRAGDVVRLTRLLEKNTEISEVYGFARKEMAPVLLHAAAFDSAIARIALIEPYSSYRSIVMNRFYNPDFIHGTVPGSLEAYDLPDLAASLAPRKLMMTGITDGLGNTIDSGNIMDDLTIIKAAYQEKNVGQKLNIKTGKLPKKQMYDLFMEWMK